MTIANTIFVLCLVVGGGLLLIAVFVGDLFGGILDALHLGIDLGGVSLMPLLLGFVSMFGVGGSSARRSSASIPGGPRSSEPSPVRSDRYSST